MLPEASLIGQFTMWYKSLSPFCCYYKDVVRQDSISIYNGALYKNKNIGKNNAYLGFSETSEDF